MGVTFQSPDWLHQFFLNGECTPCHYIMVKNDVGIYGFFRTICTVGMVGFANHVCDPDQAKEMKTVLDSLGFIQFECTANDLHKISTIPCFRLDKSTYDF